LLPPIGIIDFHTAVLLNYLLSRVTKAGKRAEPPRNKGREWWRGGITPPYSINTTSPSHIPLKKLQLYSPWFC